MRAGSSSSTAHAPPRAAGSNPLPLCTLIAGPMMLEEEHKARIDGVYDAVTGATHGSERPYQRFACHRRPPR